MANKDDYLTEYRQFFEEFANTVEPNDQLPVKLGSYKFVGSEVVGGIVDWCLQYLNRKSCPSTLIGPLIKITIDEIRIACRRHPLSCGFNPNENVYEPLKLMQAVMSKMNEICLRYLDNSQLDNLPAPPTVMPPIVSMCATRNTRRRMEDRHIVIHDVNSMFNIQDSSPASYYAIFDGHAGQDAASYSAAHLHQFLFESDYYPTDPERALKEAFLRTDEFFLEKSRIENFRSGTTAVCALLRPKEETLYVAWVGDSQALLVNRGKVLQIVKPHKPCREDEKDRIEANGGSVIFWGMWRVNGQLAVSRAIGDPKLKPYVTAEPDVVAVPLDGNEEFLIMACDGLWDFVTEDVAAIAVYNRIKENPDNVDGIAEHLADIAKQEGSRDNISVIVIFLKDPTKIAKKFSTDWGWTTKEPTADAAMDTSVDNTNNTANNSNITPNDTIDLFDVFQKPVPIPEFKSNGTIKNKSPDLNFFEKPTNGKRSATDFDDEDEEDDEDFGPETNVDAVDDVLLSPTIAAAKALIEGKTNNNPFDVVDNMETLAADFETKKKQISGFETLRECREETPTPPADSVLDSSGLADNVAESGEDSEDEWNYYPVDPKEKEDITSVETDTKVSTDYQFDIEFDEMSQLNPDAKEFVPVSPSKNNSVSPAPNFNTDLVDADEVISQSPRRAIQMNIDVPSRVDFCREAKQRPHELVDDLNFDVEGQTQNGYQLSSQEIMQNLLNDKDASEIEFHPSSFGASDDKENNLPCVGEQTKAALINDEQVANSLDNKIQSPSQDNSDLATFVSKSQDPMSMSFYQDKNEEGSVFNTNPFDLNAVQMLPDDINDIQEFSDINKETSEAETQLENVVKSPVVNSEGINTNQLSPANTPDESFSPLQSSKQNDVCDLQKPQEQNDLCNLSRFSNENLICDIPLAQNPCKSPNSEVGETPQPPLFCDDKVIKSLHVDVCETSKSPIMDVHSPLELSSSLGPISPKSPIPELTGLISPDITASIVDENVSDQISINTRSPVLSQTPIDDVIKSPEENLNNILHQDHVSTKDLVSETVAKKIDEDVCDLDTVKQVIEDITSNEKLEYSLNNISENIQLINEAKQIVEDMSNITNKMNEFINQPEEDANVHLEMNENDLIDVCKKEATNILSNIENDFMKQNNQIIEPVKELIQETEHIEQSKSPDNLNSSNVESEIAPSEINSFLDRSLIPEVTSPLSPTNDIEKFQLERPELWKCEYPLPPQHESQIDIKCETIQPEYPIHTIASPSEESKENDTPPPAPVILHEESELKQDTAESEIVIKTIKNLDEVLTESKEIVVPELNMPDVAIVPTPTKTISKTSPKPKTDNTTKKPLANRTTATSSIKSLPSKQATTAAKKGTVSSTNSLSTTTKVGSTKPAAPKPKTPVTPTTSLRASNLSKSSTTPKSRTSVTTVTSKPNVDKKQLSNGDVKVPIKQTLLKRPLTSTLTSKPPASAISKTSSTRPASAPKITTSRITTTSSTIAKSRPTTITSKSTTTTTTTTTARVTSSKAPPKATTTTTTTAAKPKTPTTTTAARPKLTVTAVKSTSKTPDTEKQIKETANKQISASRTTATRTTMSNRIGLTATKKVDPKVSTLGRTSTTTRTTTNVKSSVAGKKPTEVTRTTITKTKSTSAKPDVEQNGVVNVIQQITTVNVTKEIDDSQLHLVKDNSPLDTAPIVDNSQLSPMEIIAD